MIGIWYTRDISFYQISIMGMNLEKVIEHFKQLPKNPTHSLLRT